jgi:hypothetical protein
MAENRYTNGKIYKIVSEKSDKVYIGSTCRKYLCERLANHKSSYKNWKAGKGNKTMSFDLIELGDVSIVLLELFPCDTKDELLSRERHYIELYKDIIINKCIPSRTIKEYREDNKEKIKEYDRNRPNKKERNEKVKEKYKINIEKKKIKTICVCGSEYRKGNKSHHEKTLIHQHFIKV